MTSEIPVIEGEVDFHAEGAGQPCKTWYTIYGPPLTPLSKPLIILHGGPGIPHNYLLPISTLSPTINQPILFYDQLGSGHSTHLPHHPSPQTFFTLPLFLSELSNLLHTLSIKSYTLLGHSWGGMLALEHALFHPPGLQSLIISDSPSDMKQWVLTSNKLLNLLPASKQEIIRRCESAGKIETEEYEHAIQEYYDRFVCRLKSTPKVFIDSMEALTTNNLVYSTMNGPSDFTSSGTLQNWSIISRLHQITIPALILNGKYDEAQDEVVSPFFHKLGGKVKWVRFEGSSHLPHLEEPEEFLRVLGEWVEGGC